MWGQTNGYAILQLLDEDVGGVKAAWVGGATLACVTATAFMIFVNLFHNPSLLGSADD